ncbi:hypothetical protein D3H35_16170 [Cohnella faecalis]|uniref:Uncharacterized protein n=1 Tax=Cohnella faecalis TaxID=2315694 RepID=A0A398CGC0_9BACL|nr:hypothetical protein D3H35_16170 [Cohnella faecalis]
MAGCGSKDDGNGGAAAAPTQMNNGGQQGAGGQNRMQADLLGKVKSVSGQTITVYKSSFTPGQGRPGGGANGGGNGQQPPADGNGQQPPAGGNGQQPPADGNGQQPPSGDGQSGGGRGGFNMDNMFTEETVDIQVTDATKIVKRSFENNQATETEIALADLKEGDVLNVDLKDGTQEAVTISLGNGGFGMGGGGMGGPRGQGNNQGQTQTPAASNG